MNGITKTLQCRAENEAMLLLTLGPLVHFMLTEKEANPVPNHSLV